MRKIHNYINSSFTDYREKNSLKNIDPNTQDIISVFHNSNEHDVRMAIMAAQDAQPEWARLKTTKRAEYLLLIAEEVMRQQEVIALQLVKEQGKTLPQANAEVAGAAQYLLYVAGWARRIEGEVLESDREGETLYLSRKPIGVVGAILPWNFPFFMIVRKFAPALLSGNTLIIKPSEETPDCCDIFAHILHKIGIPPGVCNIIYGDGLAGDHLCKQPEVGMISFTGSVETGKKIMASCSQNIKKVNLELGGKAPAIVSRKADIDLAVQAIKDSKIINAGQTCICVERVYVERAIADDFLGKLTQAFKETTFGDSIEDQMLEMGPLINFNALEKIEKMVNDSIADGAQLLCGGSRSVKTNGAHYQPTLLVVEDNSMAIMQEEIFGPVLPVMIVDDILQAVHLANDSRYGLSSSVYSDDINEIGYACENLAFGEVYVNRENIETMQGYHAGRRQSGIGGTDGKHGLYDYMETQVTYWQSRHRSTLQEN